MRVNIRIHPCSKQIFLTTKMSTSVHPNKVLFLEGAKIILTTWSALRISVDQEWGGHFSQEKASWLIDALVEHFDVEGKKVEKEDLEDILLDVMAREFNVILEDESEREIASLLYNLYHECISGKTDLLDTLRSRQQKILATSIDSICTQQESGPDGEEEDNVSEESNGEEEFDCAECKCHNGEDHIGR